MTIHYKEVQLLQLLLETMRRNTPISLDERLKNVADELKTVVCVNTTVNKPEGMLPDATHVTGLFASLPNQSGNVNAHHSITLSHLPQNLCFPTAIEKCLIALKESESDETLATVLFPTSWYNKKKTFRVNRGSLRRLRQRNMVNNGAICWLNDEVRVYTQRLKCSFSYSF